MVIVTTKYENIKKPHSSDNFFIRKEHIKRIWDKDPGLIGILFTRMYSTFEYELKLDAVHKAYVASDIITFLFNRAEDITLSGRMTARGSGR